MDQQLFSPEEIKLIGIKMEKLWKAIINIVYDKGNELEIHHINGYLESKILKSDNYKGIKTYTNEK